MSKQNLPWHKHGIHKYINHTQCLHGGQPLLMQKKEHINVDKSGPLTAVRNLIGEFQGVKITKENTRERKKTLQDVGEQKDAREKLHTLKRTQQHKTTYPKKTQEIGHNANTNWTIVSHNINHNTNIAASSISNIQNIQLDETHINAERKYSLSSNEEYLEEQIQPPPQ